MKHKIYQLRIEIYGTDPAIWRSIKVSGKYTFWDLHDIIQIAMEWDNDHLFEFYSKNVRISDDPDTNYGKEIEAYFDEITIQEVLKRKGSKIIYKYDFGDDWDHIIVVESTEKSDIENIPICVAGENAPPFEDCGGIWGYYNIISVLKNPKHPEHEQCKEWYGKDFDPAYFNIDKLNEVFSELYSNTNNTLK